MQDFDYDLFVIGAGSGGVRASRIAASLGAKVAVAEEKYYGGTCVNVGCVPKKLFSYAAHYFDDFEDSRGYGWDTKIPNFDWSVLKANKDKEITRLNGIYQSILNNHNVEIFDGRAELIGANTVSICGKTVTARYIIIAVGGWPWVPEFEGNELAENSNDIFAMETLPNSMLVVGGGYIAVEFASIFSRLGVNTTLMYRGNKLLRGFDEEVRDFITDEIGNSLTLRLEEDIQTLRKSSNGILASLTNGEELEVDKVIYATGRKPNTKGLGLECAGVEMDNNGAVMVNDEYQTSCPNIYAIGDVIDRVALTPVALTEGQILANKLFGKAADKLSYNNIPTAVFCHPNIGSVGLSEEQARVQAQEQGGDIDVFAGQFKTLRHTLSGREERSLVKLIVNKTDDKVLGLHMVGPDAGEIVQGFAVAINCGASKADFDRTVAIHPTLAEEFVTMSTPR